MTVQVACEPSLYEVIIGGDGTISVEMFRAGLGLILGQYMSLSDLFIALLYADISTDINTPEDITLAVAPEWRETSLQVLDAVYAKNRPENDFSPRQRYMLYQQVRGNLTEYSVKHRKDRILEDISQKLREQGCKHIELVTYEDIVQNVVTYGVDVPVKDYYGFSTPLDLDNWVLQQVIDSGIHIVKCKNCGRYFSPKKKDAEYCNHTCKTVYLDLAMYCGQSDLVKKSNNIIAVFDRKVKSEFYYLYLPSKADLSSDYDAFYLFQKADVDRSAPLGKEEFKKLRRVYMEENEQRRGDFVAVYKLFTRGDLTAARVEEKKAEYMNWLVNVHQQIKAVSKSKKHFDWEE